MPGLGGVLTGKYRKLLIPHDQLPDEAAALHQWLQTLQNARHAGFLTDAEFTAFFVLLFAARRAYGVEWQVNRRAGKLQGLLGWMHNESKPAIGTLLATLKKLQIPGMPGMIFSVLCDWLKGEIDLRLAENPTSAAEMLAAQAEGWRYITVDIDSAMTGRVIEHKRDAFEFALHDLGHAWAFFKAEYEPGGQVNFFRVLQRDLPALTALSTADAKFASDLEYCMSDMNSHPEHLRQYLQGVIIEAYYRQRGAGGGEEFSEENLARFLAPLNSLAPSVPLQV